MAAAGPWFELVLWSLATLAWRVTERGTAINTIGYLVMTASGIKTLFNLNPLLKLDGYYLLSDALDAPNLRRRAFGHLGAWIKRACGLGGGADAMTARERRIFLGYGLAAAVFSLGILGAAFAKLGHYLVGHGQPLGFALLVGLVGAKLRRRLRRLFPGAARTSGDDQDFDTPEDATERVDPAGEPSSPPDPAAADTQAERRSPTRVPRLLLAAAAALAIAALGRWELRVRGPFLVLPIHNADVRAAVDGTIDSVFVREGQAVRQGERIARLSDRDLTAELRKTQAAIEQSRARLALLEAGPTPQEVAVAKAELGKATDHVAHARERLRMDKTIYEQELISRRDYLATRDEAATAQGDLAEARSRLALLVKGARPEEVAAARAELAGLQSQRDYLEEQLRLLDVASPITGVVATPSVVLLELKDRLVHKGDLIAKVYEYRTLTAQIPISERDIADVRAGSRVLLKPRSYPDRTFGGVVTAVAAAAEGSGAGVDETSPPASVRASTTSPGTILVTTEIDNRSLLLKPGMTGEAKILAGRMSGPALLARWLSHTVRVEFWSWS